MKTKNSNDNQLPDLPVSARQAMENYPRLAPSPDFNARVIARALIAPSPSRLELFCDRLDEIFAHPILKLVGVACLGAALAGGGAALALRPHQHMMAATPLVANASPSLAKPSLAASQTSLDESLYAWSYGMSHAPFMPLRREKIFTPQNHLDQGGSPESDPNERSSSCRAARSSLV